MSSDKYIEEQTETKPETVSETLLSDIGDRWLSSSITSINLQNTLSRRDALYAAISNLEHMLLVKTEKYFRDYPNDVTEDFIGEVILNALTVYSDNVKLLLKAFPNIESNSFLNLKITTFAEQVSEHLASVKENKTFEIAQTAMSALPEEQPLIHRRSLQPSIVKKLKSLQKSKYANIIRIRIAEDPL